MRHIDWNVTARLDEPYVRQYTEDRELTAWLLLDRSRVDGASAPRGAARTSCSPSWPSTLARLLAGGGNRVGAILFDDDGRAGRPAAQRSHPRAAAGARARQAPADHRADRARRPTSPRCCTLAAGTIRRRSLVFVISDFITGDGWERPLARLAQRHEVVAIRVVDPLERELPDVGLIVVEDAETGEQLLVDTERPDVPPPVPRRGRGPGGGAAGATGQGRACGSTTCPPTTTSSTRSSRMVRRSRQPRR